MHDDAEHICRMAADQLAAGDPGTRAQAVATLRGLAEGGHAEAQFQLGLHLAHHPGNEAEAARWCAAAARQGLAAAQFNLGLLYAAGHGVAEDADTAERWLRLSAANGVPEAESCLELIHREPGPQRPSTWDEAETRASVALARTDPDAPKSLRFAEYYVDPSIDLLIQRCRLSREQGEDIAQQFFLEFEEPLAKGAFKGRPWKESLRAGFDPGRATGGFRPYLGRVLENFARDWMRKKRTDSARVAAPAPVRAPDLDLALEHHREWWQGLLDRFRDAVGEERADAARAARVIDCLLREELGQAETGRRLGISERTVRSDLRFATELLREWLRATLAQRGLIDELAEAGLQRLPDWLHHPVGAKRARALLFLALANRRLATVQGT